MKRGILITLLVIVILVIFLALVGGYVYMQFTREPYVPENSFLKIDLAGKIVDSEVSAFSKNPSIRDLWYHIKRAKIDTRIKGIVLKVSYIGTGFAKIEDIGRLIKDFRTSGKPVYAFIEYGGIKEYYLSTFADKVYLFKGGQLLLNGLAVEAMFLKNALSYLGIKADMFHIGEYKTASSLFTDERMTPAHKESFEKLLDDLYTATLEGIAANRGLDMAAVKNIFEETPILNRAYLDAKLIDNIIYEDEIFNDSKKEHKTVSFNIYRQTTSPLPYEGVKKIAVIFASGEIHSGKSGGKSIFGGDIMGADTVARQLKRVRKNPSIKAVVLRIDSPGGSVIASDVIRRQVELVAGKKPLVISMSDLAASGGYWLSMSSSEVMALPQTITGSIGVVAGKFVLKGLYDKIGVSKEIVKTSKYADMYSDYREFNKAERDKMMSMMQNIYRSFLEMVGKHRKMKPEEVDKVARGRVWVAKTALELGLVDKLGGLDEAIEEAKNLAEIPAAENVGMRVYPRKKSVMDMIFEFFGANATAPNPVQTMDAKISMYKKFFPALMVPYRVTID